MIQMFRNMTGAILLAAISASSHAAPADSTAAAGMAGAAVTDGDISSLLWQSAGIALTVIMAAFLLAQSIYKTEKGSRRGLWDCLERHVSGLFVAAWILGFSIYSVGMFIVDGPITLWTGDSIGRLIRVAPMAVIHAFGMFLLESDISAVHEEFHGNLFFMTLYSLAHFLAALVSLLFVIKHFGYNMVARAKLWIAAHSGSRRERLYLFWGLNAPSYRLAKDIREQNDQGRIPRSFRILFVQTSDEDDGNDSQKGVDRLLDFLSLKNTELDKLKELQCLSTHTYHRLSKYEFAGNGTHGIPSILRGRLGLGNVTRLMARTTAELHIFMLGEEEENNIKATINLCNDADVKAFAGSGRKVRIYCHARHDSINRVIEDGQSGGNIEVRIVDSSHDSINELKGNEACHPVHFVDIDSTDNPGTVNSAFTGLIVGFGETGQDAARFLYEFGAFVDSGSAKDDDIPDQEHSGGKVWRAPFRCYVADHNLSRLQGHFTASMPALLKYGDDGPFSFNDCDIRSGEYYSLLEAIAQDLNYVVVSLKDDELSMTAAVDIFNYVRRNRKDISRFRIFVRQHDTTSKQHIQAIVSHYNQTGIQAGNSGGGHIVLFGSTEELYTYRRIIDNEYEAEGKVYNDAYCKASGNKGKKDVWLSRHRHFLSLKTLDGYSELRRKEAQDVANAYHAQTKIAIMKEVCNRNPDRTVRLRECLDGDATAIPLFGRTSESGCIPDGTIRAVNGFSEFEQQLFRNIARLEHLRWNASHEALGYTHFNEKKNVDRLVDKKSRHGCNERFKLHNCILNWEELDEESKQAWWPDESKTGGREYPDYKLYDYIVITTSLRLHAGKCKPSSELRRSSAGR